LGLPDFCINKRKFYAVLFVIRGYEWFVTKRWQNTWGFGGEAVGGVRGV
jgi:hypothetical protein